MSRKLFTKPWESLTSEEQNKLMADLGFVPIFKSIASPQSDNFLISYVKSSPRQLRYRCNAGYVIWRGNKYNVVGIEGIVQYNKTNTNIKLDLTDIMSSYRMAWYIWHKRGFGMDSYKSLSINASEPLWVADNNESIGSYIRAELVDPMFNPMFNPQERLITEV